ncbi:EAL domain-containing protein [Bacillus rubiinfantis]|uniref:EAL domain-containing protein n=1 Tax=Bacillus rubiinfantis TaxID=1499680 RepID=UPI000AAD6111|nr:EAL domain-containing protein [Bacillus rubiinfantis]
MSQINQLTNGLALDKAGDKMQKIIFDIIFQHVKDMVFVMKVETGPLFRYLFINESGMKQAKISIESIGQTFQDVLPDEIASFLQHKYEQVLKKADVHIFDDQLILEDQSTYYGETILTPIFNEENQISYIVAVTRDVTEWSIEKLKIVESEQKYRSIVEHNMDAIFMINPEGIIIEANPVAASLTGFPADDMLNQSIYDIINDRDIEDFKKLLEKTCSGFALESFDCKIRHRNGSSLIVQMKTVPIVVYHEITGLYVILKDLSEQEKNMETIKFMAFHDQLTGLFNRRALIEHLNKHIYIPAKRSKEFALFSIDLDRFKYLNDTLGHLAGDEILKRVADRLTEFQNNRCTIYRLGGDEFSILLLHTNRQEASDFVARLFASFSKSFYFNSQEYFISPSIGISMYPNDGKDAEMLIKNADEALFRVKEKGKAHYQFYRTEMNSAFTNVVTLETHLRRAIEKNELMVYYQPQVDIMSETAKSFEALLRWKDNEFGFISPGVFIPLAEDTGLIISIGYWVIETVCQQIKYWQNNGYSNYRVAINISPKQFQHPSLVSFIEAMIHRYGIKASNLELEITEGVMNDTKETIPILKRLKQLGLSISVDDFGTGYSSLSYIKQFPIDALKIDQSFMRDIMNDEKNAAITSTIIHLGKRLGLEVIAEGVEDVQQVEFLQKEKCNKIQGFYYSRPIPAFELEQKFLLKKN